MRKPILCVIAGGGCRQIESAIGALLALEEAGIRIDLYRGCSAGAIVSSLAASDVSAAQLREIVRSTPIGKLLRPLWWHQLYNLVPFVHIDYLYDNSGIHELLQRYMTPAAAERCQVALTRLRDRRPVMMPTSPVRATGSAAFPEAGRPVEIDGERYIDGGVKCLVPLPSVTLRRHFGHVYIILPPDDPEEWIPCTRIGRAIKFAFDAMEDPLETIKRSGWFGKPNVTVIKPPAFPASLFSWSQDRALIDHAHAYTRNLMEKKK